jgi:hypothetical protein
MAELPILKQMHDLLGKTPCARSVEDPYYRYFCGEQASRHEAPFDRAPLTPLGPRGWARSSSKHCCRSACAWHATLV